jgi:putative acetyltransferase
MADPHMVQVTELPERMPDVRAMFREYAAELGANLNFQGFEQELADLPGCYSAPEGCILLMQDGDVPVGCVALRPLEDRTAELKRMYVRPAYRRKGLAADLAEAILNLAVEQGYRRVRLDTLGSMTAARALYESLGFKEIEPYYHNPLPNVVYYERDFYAEARDVVARNTDEIGSGPWAVVLYDDDETTMDFVHMLLSQMVGLSPKVAAAIMEMTHFHGSAIAKRFEERDEAESLHAGLQGFIPLRHAPAHGCHQHRDPEAIAPRLSVAAA